MQIETGTMVQNAVAFVAFKFRNKAEMRSNMLEIQLPIVKNIGYAIGVAKGTDDFTEFRYACGRCERTIDSAVPN